MDSNQKQISSFTEVYVPLVETFVKSISDADPTGMPEPFFPVFGRNYSTAKTKIVFIGMETRGYGCAPNEIKGKMVTVEKVDIRWDKNKKVTVKVTGSPALNTATNVVDLSGKADGPVTGTIDTFVLTFNNAGAGFDTGQSLAYTGKKNTKTVIKGKGKPSENTFTLVDWSAKGKK